MDINQLCRTIRENYHRLKDEKKALLYLRYQFELLNWKLQKLKLGAIVFELKEHKHLGIVTKKEYQMRYIRQDTSLEEEMSLEAQLKNLEWRWDIPSFIGLFVAMILCTILLIALIYLWLLEKFPEIMIRDERLDELSRFTWNIFYVWGEVGYFKEKAHWNYWLVDLLTQFCATQGYLL